MHRVTAAVIQACAAIAVRVIGTKSAQTTTAHARDSISTCLSVTDRRTSMQTSPVVLQKMRTIVSVVVGRDSMLQHRARGMSMRE